MGLMQRERGICADFCPRNRGGLCAGHSIFSVRVIFIRKLGVRKETRGRKLGIQKDGKRAEGKDQKDQSYQPGPAETPVPSPDIPLSEAYSSAIVSISHAADLKAS